MQEVICNTERNSFHKYMKTVVVLTTVLIFGSIQISHRVSIKVRKRDQVTVSGLP